MIQSDSGDKRKDSSSSDTSPDSERRPSKRHKRSTSDDENSTKKNRWTLEDSDVNPETLLGLGVGFLPENSEESSVENDLEGGSLLNGSNKKNKLEDSRKKEKVKNMSKGDNGTPKVSDCFLKRKSLSRPKGEDVFSKLSDEMILSIFRLLPKKTLTRCSLVCKRWNRIALDEVLWSRLDLASRVLQSGSMFHILLRRPIILRLAQADIRTPIFPSGIPTNSKLQYLDLSMTVLLSDDLAKLLSTCRFLKKLSLEHCVLNEQCCENIGKNAHLEVLNLTLCYGLNNQCVTHILSGCKRLNSLNLGWTCLAPDALSTIVEMLPLSMQRLNLSGCRKNLNDSHVIQLIKTCPDLIELDLSDSTNLTSETIEYLSKLTKIEYFALSRCYSIPPNQYIKLALIPSLLYLDVFGLLSDQSIQILQQSMPEVGINKFIFSSVARPTVGVRRTSIWGLRVRD